MKNFLILSMLILFAMICSCQKQDSAVEQQLAQQKVEQDAREEALYERLNAFDSKLKALDERVKALAEKVAANTVTNPSDVQPQNLDPAEAQAERERAAQQLADQIRAMMPDRNAAKAEKDRQTQERLLQKQVGPQQLQNQKQRKLEISGRAIFPSAEATSPTPSPALEAASPTPSSTP